MIVPDRRSVVCCALPTNPIGCRSCILDSYDSVTTPAAKDPGVKRSSA